MDSNALEGSISLQWIAPVRLELYVIAVVVYECVCTCACVLWYRRFMNAFLFASAEGVREHSECGLVHLLLMQSVLIQCTTQVHYSLGVLMHLGLECRNECCYNSSCKQLQC